MPSQPHIREYIQGDETQIAELLNKVFTTWPKHETKGNSNDYWAWKYHHNPSSNQTCVVTEHEGNIIGCAHRVPRTCKIGENLYKSSSGADAAVDPSYRKRGIWQQMVEKLDAIEENNHVDLNFFITGNPTIIKTFEKSPKFQRIPFKIHTLVRIRDIDQQIEAMPMKNPKIIKLAYKIINQLNMIKHLGKAVSHQVHSVNSFNSLFDVFWEKVHPSFDFILDRGSDYLNWRYGESGGDYEFRVVFDGEDVRGFSVLCINRYNPVYPVGFIVDLLSSPDDEDCINSLLVDAVSYFDDRDVNIVNYLSCNSWCIKVAESCGFVRSPILFHAFIKSNQAEVLESVARSSVVHFSWGDHDSLPVSIPEGV